MVKRSAGGNENDPLLRRKKYALKSSSAEHVDPKLLKQYRTATNPMRKRELFTLVKKQNKDAKRARRSNREQLRKHLKDKAPQKAIPITKERLRKPDITFIEDAEDPEIQKDEADDEFARFYAEKKNPKVLITTCENPSHRTKVFVKEAKWLFPNSVVRPRKDYKLNEITQIAVERGFTDLVIIGERLKQPHTLIVSHLPEGPTAYFRISNFVPIGDLDDPAERTAHYPELILKNFDTRLGRRISRMIQALFPATRDYAGRAVATFLNQRDYIFLRVHRYIFDSTDEVRIQEMGPRFTLRLMALQLGVFDPKFGEYEWFRKKEHDQDKLEWYL